MVGYGLGFVIIIIRFDTSNDNTKEKGGKV